MVNYNRRLDDVFGALADPTRRRIVERLARGEMTVGEIAAGFALSQPAISKHVKVLERSQLIARSVEGRVHRVRLQSKALLQASGWLDAQRAFWESRLDSLGHFLAHSAPRPSTQKGKK
ncbi:MAG: winged helix-turn-helix transcriptional regulator [Candidatus Eremiobacteraeota bacterium]|nr:winged helix-turn-helix transcriptional regulator [Candidatus Eremiobacteraeota bacterium]